MAACSGYSGDRVICIGKSGKYYYRTNYSTTTSYLTGSILHLSARTKENTWIDMFSNSNSHVLEVDGLNLYNAYFGYSAATTTWYKSQIPGNGIKTCTSGGNSTNNYCLSRDGYLYYKAYNSTSWTKSNLSVKG